MRMTWCGLAAERWQFMLLRLITESASHPEHSTHNSGNLASRRLKRKQALLEECSALPYANFFLSGDSSACLPEDAVGGCGRKDDVDNDEAMKEWKGKIGFFNNHARATSPEKRDGSERRY